ncbi:hypothetical protein Tco_0378176 [Tanacetum coccineum]
MAEYSQKWHNGTSLKARSTKTSDGLAVIQAQLNNLRREIKKVNEKRLITHSLEHPINLQDSREQQGQDSTNATMEILRILIEDQIIEEFTTQIHVAESTNRHEEKQHNKEILACLTDAQ